MYIYIYMHIRVCKCIGMYIHVLFNMHLKKLITDFHTTSILYLAYHLQLKIRKIDIIHAFTRYKLFV